MTIGSPSERNTISCAEQTQNLRKKPYTTYTSRYMSMITYETKGIRLSRMESPKARRGKGLHGLIIPVYDI
jgi:hypothetical protein